MKLLNFILLILTFLSGCAGVGMVYSSDPNQKLEDAAVLNNQQNRPLAAKRLILEVISTCEESKDRICTAKAWVQYGFLLRSESAGRWEQEHGKGAFPDNRYDESAKYFEKAATTFVELKIYDKATHAYYNQGITFELAGRKPEACISYSKSLDTYKQNINQNPNAKPFVPSGFSNYEDFIDSEKKRVGCK
jgi:tetratricopeptide (TPR) repeat protein